MSGSLERRWLQLSPIAFARATRIDGAERAKLGGSAAIVIVEHLGTFEGAEVRKENRLTGPGIAIGMIDVSAADDVADFQGFQFAFLGERSDQQDLYLDYLDGQYCLTIQDRNM